MSCRSGGETDCPPGRTRPRWAHLTISRTSSPAFCRASFVAEHSLLELARLIHLAVGVEGPGEQADSTAVGVGRRQDLSAALVGHDQLEPEDGPRQHLHWLELGPALSLSRRLGSSMDEDLCGFPRLRWSTPEREALGPVYQTFLHVLLDSIPGLRQPAARDLLSLGVGTYHLVATHYWPGNVARTVAFWAGGRSQLNVATSGRNGIAPNRCNVPELTGFAYPPIAPTEDLMNPDGPPISAFVRS